MVIGRQRGIGQFVLSEAASAVVGATVNARDAAEVAGAASSQAMTGQGLR